MKIGGMELEQLQEPAGKSKVEENKKGAMEPGPFKLPVLGGPK